MEQCICDVLLEGGLNSIRTTIKYFPLRKMKKNYAVLLLLNHTILLLLNGLTTSICLHVFQDHI